MDDVNFQEIGKLVQEYENFLVGNTDKLFEYYQQNREVVFSALHHWLSEQGWRPHHLIYIADTLSELGIIEGRFADNFLLNLINYSYCRDVGLRPSRLYSKVDALAKPRKGAGALNRRKFLAGYFVFLVEQHGGSQRSARTFLTEKNIFDVDEREIERSHQRVKRLWRMIPDLDTLSPMLIALLFSYFHHSGIEWNALVHENARAYRKNLLPALEKMYVEFIQSCLSSTENQRAARQAMLAQVLSQDDLHHIKQMDTESPEISNKAALAVGSVWFRLQFLNSPLPLAA